MAGADAADAHALAATLADVPPEAFVPTLWIACAAGDEAGARDVAEQFGLGPDHLAADRHRGFRLACAAGAVELARWLAADDPAGAARAHDCQAFFQACRSGAVPVVELIGPELTREEVRAGQFRALRDAAAGGHLGVLEWLGVHAGVERPDVAADDHAVIRLAAAGRHPQSVWWLAQFYANDDNPSVARACLAQLGIR